MQWQAILLLAAAPLVASTAVLQAPATTTDSSSAAKGTDCKKNHAQRKVTARAADAPAPTAGPEWPVFTWQGKGFTGAAPSGWFTIEGKTLKPGGRIRVHGTQFHIPFRTPVVTVKVNMQTSTVPLTKAAHPVHQDQQKAPVTQPGEPQGQQRPQPTNGGGGGGGGNNNNNNDNNNDSSDDNGDDGDNGDDAGSATTAAPSISKDSSSSNSGSGSSSTSSDTALGGIDVTSAPPMDQGGSATSAPASSSTNAAKVAGAPHWLGAAVAGFAYVLV